MSTEENEFKKPKMWHFTGHTPYMVQPNAANKLTAPQRQMRHQSFGLIALSFDRAYTKLREIKPEYRITSVQMHDANIDLIIDDPVAYMVVEKMGV